MEYTVQKLARIAGISARALRYYDEIGILKPARINSSGYRIYGKAEVDRLQQILFYKELGVGLDRVREIIDSPSFDSLVALYEHRRQLLDQKIRLEQLINSVDQTITEKEGGRAMRDSEKFAGFKQRLIEENEKKYGQEIREKYGYETVDQSNQALKGMSQEQYKQFEELGQQVLSTLEEAIATGDPGGELAQKTAGLHARWLTISWGNYSREAHAGLAQMYVDDPRFTAFYDEKVQAGATTFLRDAVLIYTGTRFCS
ncbi:MAG: MerR family transcriptional regulator [Syntrophomonadaceae bacterium]|jgi:DNA-binding transcriptional MerR regulator|nr:MerR family transcriptional regulator [Syntrophomonadaceae bacterium]